MKTMQITQRQIQKSEYFTDGKRHLVCVPYSVENLHNMAVDLSIGRHWFHTNHYDIPKRRMDEITSKCTVVSSKDIVKIIRGMYDRTNNSSGDDL
jgi:hypothetical protein